MEVTVGLLNGDEANDRKEFKCNTKGFCFICLGDIRREENGESDRAVSILTVLRYLGVNAKQIFASAFEQSMPGMLEAVSSLGSSDILVDLCSKCGNMSRKASALIQTLELLQMEIDFSLNSIQEWIFQADESATRKEEYRNKMKSDIYTVTLLAPFDRLRQSIRKNCSKNISRVHPKVAVERIDEPAPSRKISKKKLKIAKVIGNDLKLESTDGSRRLAHRILRQRQTISPTTEESDKKTSANMIIEDDRFTRSSRKGNQKKFSKTHSEKIKRNTICEVCHKSFSTPFNLKKHLMRKHNGTGELSSAQGDAGRIPTSILKSLKTPHRNSRRLTTFPCTVCGRDFNLKQHMKRHNEEVHLKIKHKCPFPGCPLSFSRQHKLKSHCAFKHRNWKRGNKASVGSILPISRELAIVESSNGEQESLPESLEQEVGGTEITTRTGKTRREVAEKMDKSVPDEELDSQYPIIHLD